MTAIRNRLALHVRSRIRWRWLALVALVWLGAASPAAAQDADGDSVLDGADNCVFFANANQADADDDGLLTEAGALAITRHADHGLVTATTLANVTTSQTRSGSYASASYYTLSGAGHALPVFCQTDVDSRLPGATPRLGAL